MKHKVKNMDQSYTKLFPHSHERLAVFLVVEISETVTVDFTEKFFAQLTCVIDAQVDANAKKTHDMAMAIDSLIMDDKAVTIANRASEVVQVAPHVLTLVVSEVPEAILSAEYANVLYTTITGIIKAVRTINPDNKQG